MKNKNSTLLISMLLCFASIKSAGQNDSLHPKKNLMLWANLGGTCSLADNRSLLVGYQVGLNVGVGQKHFFFLRKSTAGGGGYREQIVCLLDGYSCGYGLGTKINNTLYCLFSVGLSYGNGIYQSKEIGTTASTWFSAPSPLYAQESFQYLGVPLALNFMWTSRHYGMGLELYANLHKHSEFGIGVEQHFGKLNGPRWKKRKKRS